VFDVEKNSETRLLCGRRALTRRGRRVTCMDLDASDAEEPLQIVVWEANEADGMEAQEVYCLNVTSYDSCKRAV